MKTLMVMGVEYPVEIPKSPTMCWQVYDFLLEQARTGKVSLAVPATLLGMYIASPKLRKDLLKKGKERDPNFAPPTIRQDGFLSATLEVSDLINLQGMVQVAEVLDQAEQIRGLFQEGTGVYREAEKTLGNSSPSHSTRSSSEPSDGGEA